MAEHSPSPTPERAIYGFVLYLGAYLSLVVYLVWAYVPDTWLHAIGLTYWPQKYWAVAVPVYCCVLIILGYFLYLGVTLLSTPNLSSATTFTDKFAEHQRDQSGFQGSVPPLRDMSLSEVSELLYGGPRDPS